MRRSLKNAKRIVIKAGTSILAPKDGAIAPKFIAALGEQILELLQAGKEVILVSSGAIAFGMQVYGFEKRPKRVEQLQAAAAIGQGQLIQAYEQFFSQQGIHAAQILLTRDGLEMRSRFLSARRTIHELLKMKALPIVNENDTVATEEIRFGDNDILSVQVAHVVHADLLIVLSDVDGFYLKDGTRIREVNSAGDIDSVLVKHLRDRNSKNTVGGMRSKLQSAKLAMQLGVPLLIVNGHDKNVINRVIGGEDTGTLFSPSLQKTSARKKWIAFSAAKKGNIAVDPGAYEALSVKKRSLLPGGVRAVTGNFSVGDVVTLSDENGNVFGRGVVKYSSADLKKVIGLKTSQVEQVLGQKKSDEIIHRNDMLIW